MNDPVIIKLQELLFNPQQNHYVKLRQAFWLYAYLLICADPGSGKLLVSSDKIAGQLNVKGTTIQSWLGHLNRQKYLSARHQTGSWAVSITGWPSERPSVKPVMISDDEGEKDDEPDKITPSLLHERIGNGEGVHYYEVLVEKYPQDILRRALSDVMVVPASRIKKSKGALFTFLVKRYAQEEKQNQDVGY